MWNKENTKSGSNNPIKISTPKSPRRLKEDLLSLQKLNIASYVNLIEAQENIAPKHEKVTLIYPSNGIMMGIITWILLDDISRHRLVALS